MPQCTGLVKVGTPNERPCGCRTSYRMVYIDRVYLRPMGNEEHRCGKHRALTEPQNHFLFVTKYPINRPDRGEVLYHLPRGTLPRFPELREFREQCSIRHRRLGPNDPRCETNRDKSSFDGERRGTASAAPGSSTGSTGLGGGGEGGKGGGGSSGSSSGSSGSSGGSSGSSSGSSLRSSVSRTSHEPVEHQTDGGSVKEGEGGSRIHSSPSSAAKRAHIHA